MSDRPRTSRGTVLSRRTMIQRAALGATLGCSWAVGLHATTLPDGPTIAVVGENTAQIALLDGDGVRTLIVLGAPTEDLIAQIPAMLTMLRRRIDLVVGANSAIDTVRLVAGGRWSHGHELLIPQRLDGTPPPDAPGRTTVHRDLSVSLGDGINAELRLAPSREWQNVEDADQRPLRWVVCLRTHRSLVLLSPSAEGCLLARGQRPAVIVTPGTDASLAAGKLAPGALAINANEVGIDAAFGSTVLVRTYRDDIARFGIGADGVTLPSWARTNHSSDLGRS